MKKHTNETQFVFSEEFTGFTTVPNTILNDCNISYKALGLYVQILQFQNSPTHKVYQSVLTTLKTDGKSSVAGGFKELVKAGYIKKEQLHKAGLFCGVKYTVYMTPQKDDTSNLFTEVRKSDFRYSDIGKSATKKKIINNKIINNKIKSSKKTVKPVKRDDDNNINQIDKIKKTYQNVISNLNNFNEKIREKINSMHSFDLDAAKNNIISNIINQNKYIYDISTYVTKSIKNYFDKPVTHNDNYDGFKDKRNKFVNFEQKEPDYETLKKLEQLALTGACIN